MLKSERFHLPAAPLPADNNIRFQYPIHQGQWVAHPDIHAHDKSFCRYRLAFALEAAATIEIHVSADQRFELFCDGAYVGMGPDRSDIEHWSFHSYRLRLEPGAHELAADVHFLGLDPAGRPWAQTTIAPGFVLTAENAPVDLNTGSAPWQATLLHGVTTERAPVKGFFVVGPNTVIDGRAFFSPPAPAPVVVRGPAGRQQEGGTILPGWKLYPSRLPDQVRRPVGGGRVRCVCDIGGTDTFPPDDPTPDPAWQAFVEGRAPVEIPPRTRTVVLWDLDEYHTAYPELTTTGGAGARVSIEWAESCCAALEGPDVRRKGNRDETAGKHFLGYGDIFLPDGPTRTFRPFWWRAGRYVRITVETRDAPLTLDRLVLLETRLPLENEAAFDSDDPEIPGLVKVSARGIQMCAHETYMDCPYYEQMMYVGDTRLQMLTAYVMSAEDRLNRRALEIFDWSRQETGFVLERCPSQPKQLSCTFAMIWILMLRDHAWWRDNAGFVKQRLKGMRCLLEEFKALGNAPNAECGTRNAEQAVPSGDGEAEPGVPNSAFRIPRSAFLLPPLPGWSFMDWVEGLSRVNSPGSGEGVSGVVNLLFLNALNAAAELEAEFGEPHLADYNRAWAESLAAEVDATFWDEERGLFAEDPGHTQYSEHSQCLALLSGHFGHREAKCFEALISAPDLLRTTVYFSFYLLETFARFGRGDLILEKLAFWKDMVRQGLKTPLEMPEPSRSDCHAWGSHPLFHLHASIAGIRPARPGFASVRIAPQPGALTTLRSTIPHPAGEVSLQMALEDGAWHARVSLPEGVEGTLCWAGEEYAVHGVAELTLRA